MRPNVSQCVPYLIRLRPLCLSPHFQNSCDRAPVLSTFRVILPFAWPSSSGKTRSWRISRIRDSNEKPPEPGPNRTRGPHTREPNTTKPPPKARPQPKNSQQDPDGTPLNLLKNRVEKEKKRGESVGRFRRFPKSRGRAPRRRRLFGRRGPRPPPAAAPAGRSSRTWTPKLRNRFGIPPSQPNRLVLSRQGPRALRRNRFGVPFKETKEDG